MVGKFFCEFLFEVLFGLFDYFILVPVVLVTENKVLFMVFEFCSPYFQYLNRLQVWDIFVQDFFDFFPFHAAQKNVGANTFLEEPEESHFLLLGAI